MTQSPGRAPDRTKKLVTYGVITAAALVLGYIEAQIPYFFTVPGIKLGLANTAAVFALYRLSWGGAVAISAVRVLVFGLLFTSPFSMLFSAAGAAVSLAVMILLKKTGKFSPVGVSAAGGAAHNLGQIAVAAVVMENTGVYWFFPVLCISGVVSGTAVGIIAGLIVKRMKNARI